MSFTTFFAKLKEFGIRNSITPVDSLVTFIKRDKSIIDCDILQALVETSNTNTYLQSFRKNKRTPDNKHTTPVINLLFTNQDSIKVPASPMGEQTPIKSPMSAAEKRRNLSKECMNYLHDLGSFNSIASSAKEQQQSKHPVKKLRHQLKEGKHGSSSSEEYDFTP